MALVERERIRRWNKIATLWAEGVPIADIAPQVGRANSNALSVEMARMKHAGWDLPPRRAGWTGHTRKVGAKAQPINPDDHRQAHRKLGHAVRSGRIQRPSACERCGRTCHPDGHHHDYSKPLEVEWLCHSCHVAHHAAERSAA